LKGENCGKYEYLCEKYLSVVGLRANFENASVNAEACLSGHQLVSTIMSRDGGNRH